MPSEPPLAVRRYGAGRYLVRSERVRSENWYLVDFTEREFPRGRCECDDFNIRIECAIKRHDAPPRWECKHIRAVQAAIHHARQLCEAVGIPFHPRIIPSIHE